MTIQRTTDETDETTLADALADFYLDSGLESEARKILELQAKADAILARMTAKAEELCGRSAR